ncbi:MAG: hypothetical protein UU34_C0024G0007 [Candidatus Curtissbacteria bacterium GW2011_GWA1_41_11]|uniref:Putative gluconeogenesis factor n=1 Tax=Candidatus Curtissbacteria bacterium GW2011_GWA1_41_11 TaxID=1618409 RepID=A0A0G0UAH7_9BACT|nr:MAG: hypothetical protein UU34_C0024G0007 [Candidatus Curtissbacteria bacterium GW2011_GWA1_41_11]
MPVKVKIPLMFLSFFRNYLELPIKKKRVVCLGGGVGTAQILKGLRKQPYELTAVVSMADDGGSAGRLRRAFSVPPPGDIVNCLAALSDEESILKELFIYRFAGKRYGKDTDLGGQKLGNLIFVALANIYRGDLNKALEEFSKIISTNGRVLPATLGDVNIWAKTKKGKKIYGEENIDLGKYNGARILSEVHLDPPNVKTYQHTQDSLLAADLIIVGPGDLFSTVLPVIIVPKIKNILRSSKVPKIFIVNIANKPFETPNFTVSDYIQVIKKHLGADVFDKILVNRNQKYKIPKGLKYKYVMVTPKNLEGYQGRIIEDDFVDENFPIYHDGQKVAKLIKKIFS